jgi:hypothetical protein
MTAKRKRILVIFLLAMFALLAIGCGDAGDSQAWRTPGQSGRGIEQAMKAFDQYLESVRWTRYWQGESTNNTYKEGKQISALVFWTKTDRRPKWGLCSSDLSLCIANYSSPDQRGNAEMRFEPGLTPQLAFASFADHNYGDGSLSFSPVSQADFEFEQKFITLPSLGLPASILHRMVPGEAHGEADRIRKQFVCWNAGAKRPPGCTGTQVFAFYNEADPNWYVLRTCSSPCALEFRGDSIEALTRWEQGWAITTSGFINNPKDDVERFKRKIEEAAMFRFEIP